MRQAFAMHTSAPGSTSGEAQASQVAPKRSSPHLQVLGERCTGLPAGRRRLQQWQAQAAPGQHARCLLHATRRGCASEVHALGGQRQGPDLSLGVLGGSLRSSACQSGVP